MSEHERSQERVEYYDMGFKKGQATLRKKNAELRRALLHSVKAMKRNLTHAVVKDEGALLAAVEKACEVLGMNPADVNEREP
jgi:hypothetical protein